MRADRHGSLAARKCRFQLRDTAELDAALTALQVNAHLRLDGFAVGDLIDVVDAADPGASVERTLSVEGGGVILRSSWTGMMRASR